MLKKILLAGAASTFLIGAAQAADVEAPPAMYDWSGFYIGASAGWNWVDPDAEYDCDNFGPACFSLGGNSPEDADLNDDGVILGGTLGANFQSDIWVFGVEGDFSWTDIDGSDSDTSSIPGFDFAADFDMDWFASVRARLGIASDNLLFYITGGLAIADVSVSTSEVATAGGPDNFQGSESETQLGWIVGAGAEYGATENVSVKLEALYYDLGSVDAEATDPVTFPTFSYNIDTDITGWIARAGINFRF